MVNFLIGFGIVLLYLWAFWALYVLVMGIYRAHLSKRLNLFTYFMSIPFVIFGIVVDVLANLLIATVVFWEWPRELLVTDRLQRHNRTGNGWRRKLSEKICSDLLDYFDPTGDHC
jgi:hypothetical protein